MDPRRRAGSCWRAVGLGLWLTCLAAQCHLHGSSANTRGGADGIRRLLSWGVICRFGMVLVRELSAALPRGGGDHSASVGRS